MKSVLISIQPKWVEKIANGEKTIELRKRRPKIETPFKCYIYATKSRDRIVLKDDRVFEISKALTGKVIGEFVCNEIEEFHEWELSPQGKFAEFEEERLKKILSAACLSIAEVVRYSENLPYYKPLYGWHISDLKIYDKPKELSEFYTIDGSGSDCCCGCVYHETPLEEMPCRTCTGERRYLYRPPQSWCYVEEI